MNAETDLKVISFDATAENIKFVGTSPIVPDDIIIGAKSGSQAKVVEILRFDGVYSVEAETDKTIEGTSESGKLNSSAQVIQDNNYYQNLSYTLKTEVSYAECIDAVNNGVTGVVIVDGRRQNSLLFEIFSDKGAGTLIRK